MKKLVIATTLALGAWLYREDWKALHKDLVRRGRLWRSAREIRRRRAQRQANKHYLQASLYADQEWADKLTTPDPWSPLHPSAPTSRRSHEMHSAVEQFWNDPGAYLQEIDLSGAAELIPWRPAIGAEWHDWWADYQRFMREIEEEQT